ncbi:MAG: GGDEF domain-containing protein [Gammaproteobacteria bacterium]
MSTKQPLRISAFYPLIAGALMVLLILFSALSWLLYAASTDFIELQKRHADIERAADELRQSSDDLTRYARLYAVTGDSEYADIFNDILAIRDGDIPRPQNYHGIYWDLLPEVREERHPPGEKSDLEDTFAELMSKGELRSIETSRLESERLVDAIEVPAFASVEEGDLQTAVRLLHSKEYRQSKHDIMLPLDDLAMQIQTRLAQETKEFARRIDILFFTLIIALIFGAFVMYGVVKYSRMRILKPLDRLARNILENKAADTDEFQNDEIGLLARHFYQMKASMEENYRDLENASFRDSLTGIYNRSYFFQQGEMALKRAARDKQKLCVMMADLDRFKAINDAHGHLSGDEALKHATSIITGNIRETDIAARFGGEEFVIVLIRTQLPDAVSVAEKIRAGLENVPCQSNGEQIKVTMSIGVTEITDDDEEISTAIARADKALYVAKEAGRNCVKTSD